MRFLVKFALLFISIAFVKGQLVVPQIDLNLVFPLPQVEQFLSTDELKQLQNDIFGTVAICLNTHCNVITLAQNLQQLVAQYVPQVNQIPIDWKGFAESAVKSVTTALHNIINGSSDHRFNKRDLDANDLQLLAQLPVDKLVQIIEVVNIADRTTALDKLRQLLQEFFPASQGRSNFDDLAANLLNHLNNLLPHLSQPPPISG